jgi:two-component system sensor histidine kinase/response regulator
MTIARRLTLLLAVPLLALLTMGVFSRLLMSDIESRTRFVAESRIEALATIGNITRSFAEIRIAVRNHVLSTNQLDRDAAREAFTRAERELDAMLKDYSDTLVVSEQGRRLLNDYRNLSRDWIAGAMNIMNLSDEGRRDEAAGILASRVAGTGTRLNKISSEWISNNQELATGAGRAALEEISKARWRMLLGNSAAVLLMAILGFLTFRKIVRPIQALESSVRAIAGGDYSKEIPFTDAMDETGNLARSVAVLKKGAAAMEEQKWVKTSAGEITAALQGAASLPDFGQRLISSLIPFLGGGVAAFYLYQESNGRLKRLAAFGLTQEAEAASEFGLGEGLVGQCAREAKSVLLSELPPGYLRIGSGLGSAPPAQVLALPLLSKNLLLGVLEIAAFRPYQERERALLDELLPVVGMSFEVLQRNLRTQELLAQTQEQARQLEEQTDELTQSQEELLAQKDQLLEQQAELTRQQEQLSISEERSRLILESSAEGIFGTDKEGNITFVNPAACRMLGYKPEELLGQTSHAKFHYHRPDGSDYPKEECPMYAAYKQGKTSRIDNEFLWRKDGSGIPVEYGATPMLKDGKLIGSVVSFTDITDRKRAEAELREAKQKAEEATQMKSMFLANMSHEIRTPMNAIIGLSHLALKTELTPKQRDYVSKVHNAGTSLLAVINDILDFSKIEAGKLDIETTEFQLDEVISSVTTLTAQKAHDKGLEFLAHVGPNIPEVLLGDPLRVGQVLTNLVNNAVKFTERGEIRLSIELLERTGEKVQIKCSVRDTGLGMTQEQAARLFQPFTQADMSTTRKHGGTGLGLTISRRLVELMGGRIWLDTEAGVGSTFHFTVWLGVGAARGVGKLVPERLAKLRVLVVDDNPTAREILQEPLCTLTHHVDAVASGKEAITAIQQQDATEPYDIVFMDWRMPGMDGLQASRHIKGDETLSRQPAIVLVTAFGREEVREEAERLQLDGFLVKPVTKSMIVDTLVNVFGGLEEHASAVQDAAKGIRLDGARLLLTEDNEINQQIAIELLESVGAAVKVANNGREAFETLANGPQPPPFDVVLMDLQMPEMDGYQATAKIRADARFTSLPIIAMTAHATIEERQRCLAAGMNDHISKPIDPNTLFETVSRFIRPRTQPAEVQAGSGEDTTPPAARGESRGEDEVPTVADLDAKDGLSRVAGNKKLYLKLLRQFVEQQGTAPTQISAAFAAGDPVLAERLAHTVKGVAGNIGARGVQSAAGTLEKLIREHASPEDVEQASKQLEAALAPLLSGLSASMAPSARPAPAETSAPPATREQTGEAAQTLARLLSEFDPGAADFLETHQAALRPLFPGEAWGRLEGAVQGYAFADAQAYLDQALKDCAAS